jgi:hypothetical protein
MSIHGDDLHLGSGRNPGRKMGLDGVNRSVKGRAGTGQEAMEKRLVDGLV